MNLKGTAEKKGTLKGKINLLKEIHTDAYELSVQNGFTGTKEEWLYLVIHGRDGGMDTSDATAVASDLAEGKTAYANGEKIVGNVHEASQLGGNASSVSRHSISGGIQVKGNPSGRYIVDTDTVLTLTAKKTEFGTAKAEDVAKGKTFTSESGLKIEGTHECEDGLDTSDATAGAENIEYGMTAYAKGEMVMGALEKAPQLSGGADTVTRHTISGDITFKGKPHGKFIVDADTSLSLTADKKLFGNASAADVAKGKTFTSASGLKAEGSLDEKTILTKTGGRLGFNLNNDGVVVSATQDTDVLLRGGSQVSVTVSYDEFGDAQASDVVKGKKFTSAAGLTVTGTHECKGGIDTSDATATGADMAVNKTAYANGVKITGSLTDVAAGVALYAVGDPSVSLSPNGDKVDNTGTYTGPGAVMRQNSKFKVRVPLEQYGNAAASDVMSGKTFTSASGLQTEGTLLEIPAGHSLPGNTEQHVYEVSDKIAAQGIFAGEAVGDGAVVRPGANIVVRVPKSEFGDASAADVAKGKTFTSAAGLLVEGTAESGGGFSVEDDGAGNISIRSTSVTDDGRGNVVI
jgi:hypothetical protein